MEAHFINVRAYITCTFHITRTRIIMEMRNVLWVMKSGLDMSAFIEVYVACTDHLALFGVAYL